MTSDPQRRWRRYRVLAWSWVATGILLLAVSIAMLSSLSRDILLENWQSWQGRTIAAVPMIMVLLSGGLIAARLPGNRYGWVLIGFGFTWDSLTAFGGALSFYAFANGWPVAIVALGDHLSLTAWVFGVMLTSFVLLLFPTGRHVSSRWRWIGRVVIVTALLAIPIGWVMPGPMTFGPPIDNPFGLTALSRLDWELLLMLPTLVLFLGILLGIASLFVRYRRAGGIERQQIKTFALGGLVFGLLMFTTFFYEFPGLWEIVRQELAFAALPVAIAVAVLRFHLWDINVVVRKTLVYGSLTILLALVYFGSVVLLQQLMGRVTGVAEGSPLAIVVSTLIIAALFTPLRRRVQNAIDRRFYRRKYDAQQVLAQFALTARDETDLDALTSELVRVVQETMQPAHVSVWLRPANTPTRIGVSPQASDA